MKEGVRQKRKGGSEEKRSEVIEHIIIIFQLFEGHLAVVLYTTLITNLITVGKSIG